jgi:hypothetical protein
MAINLPEVAENALAKIAWVVYCGFQLRVQERGAFGALHTHSEKAVIADIQ